jgi:transposase, IS5 family
MQGKAIKASRKRASTPLYVSPNQLILSGFETPFAQSLTKQNRWVKMSQAIPWDRIVKPYDNMFSSAQGRPPISGRVIIGAMIIKHIEDFTDRDTITHIQENMFMQYFLGYSSFTNEAPFSAALFVEIRKRLSLEILSKINEVIVLHCIKDDQEDTGNKPPPPDENTITSSKHTNNINAINQDSIENKTTALDINEKKPVAENKGKLITDATVAPQNITYPTDLKLLNAARVKSEELIDKIYSSTLHGSPKPRTYRQIARKDFLNTAKKKGKTQKIIYKANGSQLRYLKRNLAHIENMLVCYDKFPLRPLDLKYLMVLHTVYQQQQEMHRTNTKRIDDRIVNIHQPHVRPIVRGKDAAKVEFGSKLQVSLVGGFTFIDHLSWDAFNESQYLSKTIENYKNRFGFYPAEVLADQIYCTRDNRKLLKEKGIKLMAKPLGRPSSKAVAVHLSPAERNPIEGKFGQAKIAYGLDNIKAKLQQTSESWIACIALVLNLVTMTRQALVSLIFKIVREINWMNRNYKILNPQILKNSFFVSL